MLVLPGCSLQTSRVLDDVLRPSRLRFAERLRMKEDGGLYQRPGV
jgi:hypothetical protein